MQLVNEIAMIFCNAERKAVQSHGFVSKWYYRNYHAHISQVQLNMLHFCYQVEIMQILVICVS